MKVWIASAVFFGEAIGYPIYDMAAFLAINRIELKELQKILAQLDEQCANMSLSVKADLAETMLRECENTK